MPQQAQLARGAEKACWWRNGEKKNSYVVIIKNVYSDV